MSFAIGDKVRLKACGFGEAGAVVRIEHRKLVIYWRDLILVDLIHVDTGMSHQNQAASTQREYVDAR